MKLFDIRKKHGLPDAESALPGRRAGDAGAGRHHVNGNPLQGPFPRTCGRRCLAWAASGAWSASSGSSRGYLPLRSGYAAGSTPNPSYQEVCSGRTGHNEVVLVVFDPAVVSYGELLTLFWEGHDPTQGMRQGNDLGTQYRSGIYTFGDDQADVGTGVHRALPGGAGKRGLWRHHHGNTGSASVLLRRGLPPAVPGQKPRGLLRAGGHRGELPRGPARLSAACPSCAKSSILTRTHSMRRWKPVITRS